MIIDGHLDYRNDIVRFLQISLELEQIIIDAAIRVGPVAAGLGASLVDRAAAGLGVEEFAGLAEEGILLAAEDAAAEAVHGEAFLGDLGREAKMGREPLHVLRRDLDALVDGAAKCHALGAIVLNARSSGGHG